MLTTDKVLLAISILASLISSGETILRWVVGNAPKGRGMLYRLLVISCSIVLVIRYWPTGMVETTESRFQKAKFFFHEHNRPKAVEEAQAIIRSEPTHAEAYKLLGACYLVDEKLADATTSYKMAASIDSQDPEAMLGLAVAQDACGQHQDAKQCYRLVIKNPKSNTEQINQARSRIKMLGG